MSFTADWDPTFAFEPSKTTWAWLPNPPDRNSRLDDDILDARIRTTIAQHLASKGMQERTVAEPDYFVNYDINLQNKMDVYSVNTYYGYATVGWGWTYYAPGPAVTQTTVREYQVGTLLVDFLDPATRRLVWRGTASADLQQNLDQDEKQARLDRAVTGILADFPPPPH